MKKASLSKVCLSSILKCEARRQKCKQGNGHNIMCIHVSQERHWILKIGQFHFFSFHERCSSCETLYHCFNCYWLTCDNKGHFCVNRMYFGEDVAGDTQLGFGGLIWDTEYCEKQIFKLLTARIFLFNELQSWKNRAPVLQGVFSV